MDRDALPGLYRKAEQQAHFDASVVTDLDQVPAEFLERVRLRLEEHIEQTESAPKKK